MTLSKKTFLLSMLIVVLSSIQLLNICDINSKSKDKNLHQSKVMADIIKTSQTRAVAKFKSRKRSLTNRNWFQNMQNQNLATNSSVFLSNKASFKYQVDYSNYNAYGVKNSNFHVTVAKNTTNRIVNIGINLISATTVKVTAPGQKWANLTITSNFTPTKDMIPTSIRYLILGAKNINDANVSLNMVYEKRTDPMTPITVKIGYFNVNNINEKVSTVLLGPIISIIVFECVLAAMALGTVAIDILHRNNIYRRICLWFEKRATNEATEGIRLLMLVAKDANEAELVAIRAGQKTYGGEGKFFPRSIRRFMTETNAMIKKANYSELWEDVDFGEFTKQEKAPYNRATNIVAFRTMMIDARNKVAGIGVVRQEWLLQEMSLQEYE